MSANRRTTAIALTGALILAGIAAIPASVGIAAETPGPVPDLAYEVPTPVIADDQIVDAQVQESVDESSSESAADEWAAVTEDSAEFDCLAKAVHREAGNQSHEGKLAVAQLILNRVESGRFADSICGVINQRGQFFQTSSYKPRRDTAQWASAVAVSREALEGDTPEVVPGAVFFHATYIAPNSWFRTRKRVATLGDHVFYR